MSIGIRELKDHLSRHIAEARDGKSITITEHGKPVARLVPLEGEGTLDKLIAEGAVTPSSKPKRKAGEPLDVGASISDLISTQRG
ncbi:type II toxin-antitoxin system prevent-host-death family antitoxin [Arthrobacter sp. H5]|uniref:type II toxin-antitoxin system Phd/YefM family antitoxin n=1 Tax=Arthrobacter sp. H5 TaxID=1267973 RepID=UPI00048041A0|nr:type II toxin-antitoxin system prevent-host-death family antitoxin [Arthrobacter sp. H5]